MPYNGFEKYFIRETESHLASGYQSTEKMPRRSFPKAPFSADAYHPNCPFIGQAKAGLLTRPRRNAFPVPQDQWQKSVAAIHPGIRNTARKRADHLGSSGRTHSSGNCRRFSRRSLLIPVMGTVCRCKYPANFPAKQDFFSRPAPARDKKLPKPSPEGERTLC